MHGRMHGRSDGKPDNAMRPERRFPGLPLDRLHCARSSRPTHADDEMKGYGAWGIPGAVCLARGRPAFGLWIDRRLSNP